MHAIFSIPFVLAFSLVQAGSAPRLMNDAEIDKAFRGKTIKGEYVDLSVFTETYRENGEADYQDARGPTLGQWSVVNGHFCTIYETMNGGCFLAVKRGENCFEFYSSAQSPGETADPQGDRHWVARGWTTDRPSTCTAETV
jgi:hypothetical protein